MNRRIVVAVDAMGGDHAPGPEVAGAVMAAREWHIPVILIGQKERIEAELSSHRHEGLDIAIHHATEVVGMHDSASDAVRKKKDSSIRVAFDLVREGVASAVVSTGNSGATMAAGMFTLKRIPGIDRPAIATVVPNLKDQTLVLDVGGNVDCKAQHLAQFALMGSVYIEQMFGKERSRVGVLSNGEEESKGNDLTREAHRILTGSSLNYIGYVEGGDIFKGTVDVVVCDGFVGNIVLKVSEGLADALGKMLKSEFSSSWSSRIGYLLAKPAFRGFRKKIDYAEYGGAPLLGIQGTGMICHGKSSARAVMNAIRLAHDFEARQVNDQLIKRLAELSDRLNPSTPTEGSEPLTPLQQGALS